MPNGPSEAPRPQRREASVHRAKPRTADLSAKRLQLVTEYKDLDVLGALVPRACQEASQRAGDTGEEEQHPRMLRIGELEGESEFPTPAGFGFVMKDALDATPLFLQRGERSKAPCRIASRANRGRFPLRSRLARPSIRKPSAGATPSTC